MKRTVEDSNGQIRQEEERATPFPLHTGLPRDANTSDAPLETTLNPPAPPFISLSTIPDNLDTKLYQQLPTADVQVMSGMDPVTLVDYMEKLGLLVYRIDQARSTLIARKYEASSIGNPYNSAQGYPKVNTDYDLSQSSPISRVIETSFCPPPFSSIDRCEITPQSGGYQPYSGIAGSGQPLSLSYVTWKTSIIFQY